ncbi:MAG: hypothetical protein Kapaf2KO_09270 [Candidatus Kapaibacteriales bacterium]
MFKILAILVVASIFFVNISNAKDGKLQDRLLEMKKIKMLEELDLDSDKADKLLVKFNSLEKQISESMDNLSESVDELEKVLSEKGNISSALANTKLMHKQLLDAQELKMSELEKVLGAEDFARYLVFEKNFREELNEKLKNRKRSRK